MLLCFAFIYGLFVLLKLRRERSRFPISQPESCGQKLPSSLCIPAHVFRACSAGNGKRKRLNLLVSSESLSKLRLLLQKGSSPHPAVAIENEISYQRSTLLGGERSIGIAYRPFQLLFPKTDGLYSMPVQLHRFVKKATCIKPTHHLQVKHRRMSTSMANPTRQTTGTTFLPP